MKAIKLLAAENIPTLATTVYTGSQALLAAMAGADYVAPYVNRIDNLPGDGGNVVSEIVHLYEQYNLSCEVIAASFKNVQQVYNAALAGAQAVTASPDIIEQLVAFPATANDVVDFKRQWVECFGAESTDLVKTKE